VGSDEAREQAHRKAFPAAVAVGALPQASTTNRRWCDAMDGARCTWSPGPKRAWRSQGFEERCGELRAQMKQRGGRWRWPRSERFTLLGGAASSSAAQPGTGRENASVTRSVDVRTAAQPASSRAFLRGRHRPQGPYRRSTPAKLPCPVPSARGGEPKLPGPVPYERPAGRGADAERAWRY